MTTRQIFIILLLLLLMLYGILTYGVVYKSIGKHLKPCWWSFAGSRFIAPLIAIVLCGLIYLSLLTAYCGSGDAALYNTHIEQGMLDAMVVHWGYYVYGMLLVAISPLPTDLTMNLGATFAGLLMVAVIYMLIMWETSRPWLASMIAVVFGTCPVVLLNGVFSEVYMIQAVACYGALLLYRRGYSFLGGVLYGYALTVTIASVVFAPLFLLPPFRKGNFIRAVCGGLLFYLVFLSIYWQGLFYGDRGLLTGGTLSVWSDPVHLLLGWKASLKHLVYSFPFILPWIAWSVIEGLRYRLWTIRVTVIIVLVLFLHVFLGGAGEQIGFDLIVIPLLFVPLVVWLSSTKAFSNRRAYDKFFTLVILAVIFNGLLAIAVLPRRNVFAVPIKMAGIYKELGEKVGDASSFGLFQNQGLYQRANNQPYTFEMVHWKRICPRPGRYVVLDRASREVLERGFGSRLSVPFDNIKIKGYSFWLVQLDDVDVTSCKEGWGI